MMPPRRVVIVDSYAPTEPLAEEFRKAGAALVRVQSSQEVPAVYQPFQLGDYLDNIIHRGDLAATARAVAAHHPVAVVPGGEFGVELADALSAELGLPGNGVDLSAARRDKFLMIEAIRRAGLAGARQLLVSSEDELAEWHKSVGGLVVVKPLRSSAGDGVFFCATPEESVAAFRAVMSATNVFSQRNMGAVAQEYLRGTEYMVNTVSCGGRHRICEMWRTTRISANGVRDLADTAYLLRPWNSVRGQLAGYAAHALDALGVAYGPAHLEIKLTRWGPVLVELGARICGANLPYYAQIALGESQLDWTVTAYLDPARYLSQHNRYRPGGLFCAFVALISPAAGTLHAYPKLAAVEALESLRFLRTFVRPGQRIGRTVNDVTYPVVAVLMHEAEETVIRDAGTIRYLDGESFYEIVPEDPGPGDARSGGADSEDHDSGGR